jgi:hypothetical protein
MLNPIKRISLKGCQIISLPEAPMCLVPALVVAACCHGVIHVKWDCLYYAIKKYAEPNTVKYLFKKYVTKTDEVL